MQAPLLISGGLILAGGAFQARQQTIQGEFARDMSQVNAALIQMQAAHQATIAAQQAGIAQLNAQVEQNNARFAEQQARQERELAAYDADRLRERNRRLQSRQRAVFGASGLQLEGSAQDVAFDTAVQGELEALLALYKGDQRAAALTQESLNAISKSREHRLRSGILSTQSRQVQAEGRARSQIELLSGDFAYQQGRANSYASYINTATNLVRLGTSFAALGS